MNSNIITIVREGEPLGSYPAWIVPHLVQTARVFPEDSWYCEGMTEALPVEDLLGALRPDRTVMVSNFPPPALQSAEPRGVRVVTGFRQIFVVTFYVILAAIIASPLIAMIFISIPVLAAAIARAAGH